MRCGHGPGGAPGSPRADVGVILADHAGQLELSSEQRRVAWRLAACRTALLGAQMRRCDHCGYLDAVYHSCRNRHCPRCQVLDQALWAEAQEAALLPTPYFHLVFTVPPQLHPFFLRAPTIALDALFAAVAETVQQVAARRLGGARVGFTAVLHTWTQKLLYHPHIHCLLTGGGLAPDGQSWVPMAARYFAPTKVLRIVFRAKLLARLRAASDAGQLPIPQGLARHMLEDATRHPWVVYAKAPLAGPAQVVRYFSRYTRRIAIANSRIVDYDGHTVRFRYLERRRTSKAVPAIAKLPGEVFAKRFLLHVLPRHFVRLRHYGLLASRVRAVTLARCREIILGDRAVPPPHPPHGESRAEACFRLFGKDPATCPVCSAGRMVPFLDEQPGHAVLRPTSAAAPRSPP